MGRAHGADNALFLGPPRSPDLPPIPPGLLPLGIHQVQSVQISYAKDSRGTSGQDQGCCWVGDSSNFLECFGKHELPARLKKTVEMKGYHIENLKIQL